ncbi:hypothetical protein EV360DRAFT_83786 [Lentinula raphanica]|nr:hypothetical protein EV360DRAFT_83786 [Lentinula raphanica]
MTEARFVTLAVPLRPGAAVAIGVPEEGLKTEMPFSKGGYRQPPLPINFACNDAAFADFLYWRLQPYVRKNAQKASSNGFIEEFVGSKEFKAVAREADKVSRLFWSVKYGKGVGVYFQSSEALQSIDTATTHLRQGFAFRTFTEAVRFQMGTQKNPANRVYKYDLSQPDLAQQVRQILGNAPEPSPPPPSDSDGAADSEPESEFERSYRSTPAAAVPQTLRRPPPSSADGYAAIPRSPHVFIQVNTPGAPTATEPAPLSEQYWGRQLLMALGLSDAAARKLGFRATTTQSADFELYCEEKYAEKVNNQMAKFRGLALGPAQAMVSRKTAGVKDRLSNTLRKAGSVKRKPTLNKRRPRIKLSRAERLQKKKQLHERKVAYKAALSEVYEEIRSLADGVHAKFPNIPVERILTDIYQSQRLKDSSKELSLYAAFTSAEMHTINSKVPEGEDKKKVHEMSGTIAKKWAGLSKEEQVAASKDQLAVLRERRESKELGTWHNADISANHDTSMSVARIKEELTRLSSRTGDESLLIIVRGSITRFHQPESFTSSERAENFVYTALKMSSVDLSLKMDAYMVLGIEGVARNQAQALLELKAKTSALILERLKEAAGKYAIKKMYYVNFEQHITRHYKISVKNWPLKEFKSPGSINTHADLTVLLNAWTSGTTYFHKMTNQEYEDWAASGGGSVDVHEVAQVAGVVEPGVSSSTPAPSAASPSTEQSNQHEASTSSSNAFVFTQMVTNSNGEAVSTTKRARKKRSDAGKPRKKRTKAVEVEGASNANNA